MATIAPDFFFAGGARGTVAGAGCWTAAPGCRAGCAAAACIPDAEAAAFHPTASGLAAATPVWTPVLMLEDAKAGAISAAESVEVGASADMTAVAPVSNPSSL